MIFFYLQKKIARRRRRNFLASVSIMNYSAPQAPNFFSALVSAFVMNVFCPPKNKRARRRRRNFFSLGARLSHDFLLSSKKIRARRRRRNLLASVSAFVMIFFYHPHKEKKWRAAGAELFFSSGVCVCHEFILSSPK